MQSLFKNNSSRLSLVIQAIIPLLRKQKQENKEFEVILDYRVNVDSFLESYIRFLLL